MKKILCITLMLSAFINAVMPISCVSFADENENIEYSTADISMFADNYYIYGNNIRLDKYVGSDNNIYIPNKLYVSGKEYVTVINNTFTSNTNIENIMFENQTNIFAISKLFYGCSNLKTALIENDGSFSGADKITNMGLTFSNCASLTEYFDLSQFTGVSELKIYGCSSIEHITSLPPNLTDFIFYTSGQSNSLKTVNCHIPESCTQLSIQAQDLNGEIFIDSKNIESLNIKSQTTANYFNTSCVTLVVPKESKTFITAKKQQSYGRHTVKIRTADNSTPVCSNDIYVLGDSLTANNNYYLEKLRSKTNDNTFLYNYSVEGDTSSNLARRTGAEEITTASDFVIPASTDKVKIELSKNFTSTPSKVSQDTGGVNCVKIDGTEGFITYNSEDKNYYFNRVNSGEAQNVSAGTAINTGFSCDCKQGSRIIIYIGTNDYASGMNNSDAIVTKLVDNIKKIINFTQAEDYIVVGCAFRTNNTENACSNTNSKKYEETMEQEFGSHFLNLRKYFIDNAYSICSELSLDEYEKAEFDEGIIPAEFYSDNTHWKADTGGVVVSNAIYEKMVERPGFLNSDGHFEEIIPSVEPTCISTGLTQGTCCKYCGKIIKPQEIIPTTDHTFKSYITEPSCTDYGYVCHKCEYCDYCYYDNITCRASHKYETVAIKATVIKNGSVETKCSHCGEVKSKSTIYYPKSITLSTTSYIYDGKVKKPVVKVVDSNGKTISSSNYTISYASGRKNVGKYAVKITFKGNYSGTKTLYFTIKPKVTSISSVTAGSKKFTVKWKKQSTQVTGYQIQYSTSSKFSSPKTVTVSSYKTTSKTISKLKGKKKYYVRVRTYKTVGSTKYYSSWSGAKSVTTKK